MKEAKLQTTKRHVLYSIFSLIILFNTLFGAGWRLASANALEGGSEDKFQLTATSIISYSPGLKNNGEPIDEGRTNSASALFWPENDDSNNFVALGFGGELILGIESLPISAELTNIQLFETSFGNPSCDSYPETVSVYISNDNNEWENVGIGCQDFDINLNGHSAFRYIKLVDASDLNKFPEGADGYDVDGIIINYINQPILTLTPSPPTPSQETVVSTNTSIPVESETPTVPSQETAVSTNTSIPAESETPTVPSQETAVSTSTSIPAESETPTVPSQETAVSTTTSVQLITSTPSKMHVPTNTLLSIASRTPNPTISRTIVPSYIPTLVTNVAPSQIPTQTKLPTQIVVVVASTPAFLSTETYTEVYSASSTAEGAHLVDVTVTPEESEQGDTEPTPPRGILFDVPTGFSDAFWALIFTISATSVFFVLFIIFVMIFAWKIVQIPVKNYIIVLNAFTSVQVGKLVFIFIFERAFTHHLVTNKLNFMNQREKLQDAIDVELSKLEIIRIVEKKQKKHPLSEENKALLQPYENLDREIVDLDKRIADIDFRLEFNKSKLA